MDGFTIHKTARSYPSLPYKKIKEDILGKRYRISLVFVGEKRAARINKKNRGKTYAPNVLSFPLDEHTGEVIITPMVAKREAQRQRKSLRSHVGFLFIHGLLHLKGYVHGATMERAEKRYLAKYRLN